MKKIAKFLALLCLALIAAFAGAAFYVSHMDADKYRPQLVKLLTDKTGRAVKLGGPIAFSLRPSGVSITVRDASIANPAWASRPDMAGMGKFEISVALLPLLSHNLSIQALSIENADILLETNASGQHNWEFAQPVNVKPAMSAAPAGPATAGTLNIARLSILNSQLAMRNARGHADIYKVSTLTLGAKGDGSVLQFTGEDNGAPLTILAKIGLKDFLGNAAFPFDASLTFGALKLTATGTLDRNARTATIAAYQISAGKTLIDGKLAASWGGARPAINGTLTSSRIDPVDFKSGAAGPATASPDQKDAARAGGDDMFSTAPLPLDSLKAADARLDIAIGEFPVGRSSLKQIAAKLTLINGNLTLAPVKADVGSQPVDLQLKLDASQAPARLTVGVIGKDVDLGELQKLASMSPFMSGQAGANIQLTGVGNSPHAIASSLGGIVTITSGRGEILTGPAANVSSLLAKIFNPQGGDAALNCLAARFTVAGGVMKDNGILIDSAPSTVSGKGEINLGDETVNLTLRAKTKLLDIGGLVPALQVSGDIAHPGYKVDAEATVQNVVGQLIAGNLNANALSSGVPDIQTPPAGQNACVYTLDHPAAASGSATLPAGSLGQSGQNLKAIGNSVLKGLFGQ